LAHFRMFPYYSFCLRPPTVFSSSKSSQQANVCHSIAQSRMFHFSCCSSPCTDHLHLIYHLKCHLSCTVDGSRPWRGLKERWRMWWTHQMWRARWLWQVGACCSRLSSLISPSSRSLQVLLSCVLTRLALSPQTSSPSTGIQPNSCHLLW